WMERRSKTFTQAVPGRINEEVGNENGIGDITIEGRYNLWRSTRWDKFATVLLGTTLPTGQFTGTRSLTADPATRTRLIATGPALQLGKGVASFTGGLLYSERWKDWWLHTSALYTVNPENDDDFSFGDVANIGVALHYTPNYDVMVGVELDTSYSEKNQDQGQKIGNSGGTVTNLAFVGDWRFLNAFGGNFKLRGSVGLPIYEDLNSRTVRNARGQPFEQVQLGDGFFGNVAIQWTFRDSPQM
ncbi:MAG: hypothetical protein LUP96_04535, partial [Methylococcaceae bacterium]|nr:hypothetical protein [Methylococcaceae bacterium]